MTDHTTTTAIAPGAGAQILGHPRGLVTLFFTEMLSPNTFDFCLIPTIMVGSQEGTMPFPIWRFRANYCRRAAIKL